jgi:GDP/UDP-N,N'-diacetylbacillosamine 2-epimerase (hydrolysing)
MKKALVMTSSRADYGVYLPLLKKLKNHPDFDLKILAFGTHLSKFHGYTISNIIQDGFDVDFSISNIMAGDQPEDIATSYGLTALKFAEFWKTHQNDFDWVFVLGDRYEMAAAVAASIPFSIPFAHLHGGETTLGAIDDIYRHSITHASKKHFVSTEEYAARVKKLKGQDADVTVCGSLSLDNLYDMAFLTSQQFIEKWNIDLNTPFLLVTVHPETIAYDKNALYAKEVCKALDVLSQNYRIVITMPNADTLGGVYRETFLKLKVRHENRIHLIENFGTLSYFSCLKYTSLVLGNSSSAIVEAASFGKYALNLGERQKGRMASKNIINIPFDAKMIIENTSQFAGMEFTGENLYFKGNAADLIIKAMN